MSKVIIQTLFIIFTIILTACNGGSSSFTSADEVIVPGTPILGSSTASVAEDANSGTHIGTIVILDIGDSPISSITLSGTGSENFDVTADGNITVSTAAVLDYETSPGYP